MTARSIYCCREGLPPLKTCINPFGSNPTRLMALLKAYYLLLFKTMHSIFTEPCRSVLFMPRRYQLKLPITRVIVKKDVVGIANIAKD